MRQKDENTGIGDYREVRLTRRDRSRKSNRSRKAFIVMEGVIRLVSIIQPRFY